jgi:hypothetical protein
MYANINLLIKDYNLEILRIQKSGVLTIEGSLKSIDPKLLINLSLDVNGQNLGSGQFYRTFKPEFQQDNNIAFSGFELAFFIVDFNDEFLQIKILLDDIMVWETNLSYSFEKPAFAHLFHESRVLKRNEIYGSGPPIHGVTPEIWELVKDFKGPILDFGCGSGALVEKFRNLNVESKGIELDSPSIRNFYQESFPNNIILYDGSLPLPFYDNEFENVVSSEVLEHVHDFSGVIKELRRVTRSKLFVTVPDILSIPIGNSTFTVPWHLLESTHYNFFTYNSLNCELLKYFRKVSMQKIVPCAINETKWFVSLAAICEI